MLAVPWIEPTHPLQSLTSGASGRREMHHAQRRRILESLFPPNAWELTDPRVKVLETEYGMLLLLDYRTGEGGADAGGKLEILPCTMVLELPGDGDQRAPRYLALQAPQGAVLQFDRAIDLRRAEIGQPTGGRLQGEVRIFSPATQPDGGDKLEIVTQNVQMDAGRVWTPHLVQFRVGRSHGSGRGLTIELLSSDILGSQSIRPTTVAGVRRLELSHLDKAHLEAPPEGLFGETDHGRGPSAAPREAQDSALQTPVEISCQGPFTFDFEDFVASFADDVNVLRLHPDGPSDRLSCRLLEIHLAPPQSDFLAGLNARDGRQMALKPDLTAQSALRRIVAVGQPVELRAPSMGAYVRADRMEYDFSTRRLRLENRRFLPPVDDEHAPAKSHGAILQHQGRHFEAPRLQYEFGPERRLGKFWASGPGVFRGPLPNISEHLPELPQDAVLEIAWQGEIRLRPHEGLHVASVTGGASARVGEVGEFRAGELHVWLREVAKEDTRPRSTHDKEPTFGIVPDRLMAHQRVTLRSSRLSGAVDKMEVWFEDAPPRVADEATPSRFASSPDDRRNRDSNQAFDLRANLVQLRLLRRGEETMIEDATLRGNVVLRETQTDKPGETPLAVSGDLVELRGASGSKMQLSVLGNPQRDVRAVAGARGVTFTGWRLQLDQAANRLWIDGPGRLTLPLRQASRSTFPAFSQSAASSPSTLAVEWRKGLNFDGQRVLIEDQVQTRGDGRVIRSDSLQAFLAQPLDFAQVEQATRAEVSRLLFGGRREDTGGVTLENQTVENGALLAVDQGAMRNLDIDLIAGRMHADGPGWIESVRQGGFDMAGPLASPTAASAKPSELTFVRVDYQEAITGQSFAQDFSQWKIAFHGSVETLLGPVSRWEERLNADSTSGLGARGMLLTSRELSIAQMGVSPQGDPQMELSATGRPHIESLSFTANGDRLSYDGAKGLLVLEGGREDARFWHRTNTGFETDGAAQRIQYWPQENRLDADLRFLDLTGLRNALTPAAPQR